MLVILFLLASVNLAKCCHWTTIIVQNGTLFDESGSPWFRWMNYTKSFYNKPVRNKHQVCRCGVLSERETDSKNTINRPWLAVIKSEKEPSQPTCSASLINKKFLVSSATCLCGLLPEKCDRGIPHFNKKSETNVPGYTVNVSPEGSLFASFPLADNPESELSETKFEVDKILVHERYNADTGDNDIAIVSLKKQIKEFSEKFLQPICLPPHSEADRIGFKDLDCHISRGSPDFPSIKSSSTSKDRLRCNPKFMTGYHSYISAWKSTPASKGSLPCYTNSYGPEKFKSCKKQGTTPLCKDDTSPFKIPLSDDCIDAFRHIKDRDRFDSDKMYANFHAGKMTYACVNNHFKNDNTRTPNYEAIDIPDPTKYGWCFVCRKNKTDCTKWGFCSRECLERDKGEGPFMFETAVNTFISPKGRQICGATLKQFCTAEIFIHGSAVNYFIDSKEDFVEKNGTNLSDIIGNNKFVQKNTEYIGLLEDVNFIEKNSGIAQTAICDEHSGGAVWKKLKLVRDKKESIVVAVLTGIVSRPGKDCKSLNSLTKYGQIPTNIRINNYLPWISYITKEGSCGHKNQVGLFKYGYGKRTTSEYDSNEPEEYVELLFMATIGVIGEKFRESLLDPSSNDYIALKEKVNEDLYTLSGLAIIVREEFLRFRPAQKSSDSDQDVVAEIGILARETEVYSSILRSAIMSTGNGKVLDFSNPSVEVIRMPTKVTLQNFTASWEWDKDALKFTVTDRIQEPNNFIGIGLSPDPGTLISNEESLINMFIGSIDKGEKLVRRLVIEDDQMREVREDFEIESLKTRTRFPKSVELEFKFKVKQLYYLKLRPYHSMCISIPIGGIEFTGGDISLVDMRNQIDTYRCFLLPSN